MKHDSSMWLIYVFTLRMKQKKRNRSNLLPIIECVYCVEDKNLRYVVIKTQDQSVLKVSSILLIS